MNFLHLKSFMVVVDEGSFSQAARRLFLSNSSLIQQITLLEREIGFSLFYRHYSGVTLTEAGRDFYQGTRHTLEIMEQTLKKASATANRKNTLRLAIGYSSFADIIREFELRNPHILLQFVDIPYDGMEYGLDRLEREEIDLFECEYTSQIPQRDFCFKKTMETHLCAVLSYKHKLAQKSQISYQEIENEHVVMHKYLFAANEQIKDTELYNRIKIINTKFSAAEVINAIETGMIYLMEAAFINRLCPFAAAIPIVPKVRIEYGLAYLRKNTEVDPFLELIKL